MVFQVSVPNPFFEGRNTVHLIKSDPITLVDTGVATDKAYDALCKGLKQNGVAVQDIKRIVLTHKHIDHIGNAWRIRRESGATIHIHSSEEKSVADVDPFGNRFAKLMAQKGQRFACLEHIKLIIAQNGTGNSTFTARTALAHVGPQQLFVSV